MVQGSTVVGRVCHIAAANPGGPRYAANQTPAERHGYNNLILLCPTHHTVIDDDEEAYTVQRLTKMKTDHEATAGTMADADAATGAQLLLSVNQSGGIAAHTIHTLNVHLPPSAPVPQALPVSAGMTFFSVGEALANAGFPGEQEFTFDTTRFTYLRLIPPSNQPRVGLPHVLNVFKQARVLPMSDNWSGATAVRNRHGAVFYTAATSHDMASFTQGFASGELWGMNNRLFQSQRRQAFPTEPVEEIYIVPAVTMEKLYVTTLPNYVQVAMKEFGLALPCTVEFGIKGIEGAYISFPHYPAGHIVGPIYEEAFRRTYPLHEPTPEAMTDLIRRFASDFYELVGAKRADMFEEKFIVAHQLPPR